LPLNAELKFREHTLASDLKGGYQVLALDVDGNGRTDLIALASGMPDLLWFEAPKWERHILAGPFNRMINAAGQDVDGDRIPEIVIADGFNNQAKLSAGTVHVARHKGDPRQKWKSAQIDALPSSHRIRAAEIAGEAVFVNAPLTGAEVERPEYRGGAPLVYYRAGEWKRLLISNENQGVVHDLEIYDWDEDGADDILTASFEGVHWFKRSKDGKWNRQLILPGNPKPWPDSGASDIALGKLGKERFLATVEPWHGNNIAIYLKSGSTWRRNVIDDSQPDVHSLRVADFDGDGRDEVVAAVRSAPRRVSVYRSADPSGSRWERTLVDDGGIAAADCAVADLNGDKLPDIACIGSATANLKWYENAGK
jgi:hypothetical protein